MIAKYQYFLECGLYILSFIDFITDIIAMGSLGSKKLYTHMILVLFTIIIERIAQILYYCYQTKYTTNIFSMNTQYTLKQQILYKSFFLEIIPFFKDNQNIKKQDDIILSSRTNQSYQTQNIHAYFSSWVCLFIQSHGMIYWGSSDPMIIISMTFQILSVIFSNTTTYIKNIESQEFLKLLGKNALQLIAFIGFWSLASELARPRFLVAHLFASLILLGFIYVLYTNSLNIPGDDFIIQQISFLYPHKKLQNNQPSSPIRHQQIEQSSGKNDNISPLQLQSQQRKNVDENNHHHHLPKNNENMNVMNLNEISSNNLSNNINSNIHQKQLNAESNKNNINSHQMHHKKKDASESYQVSTPQQMNTNISNYSRVGFNYNLNNEKTSLTPLQVPVQEDANNAIATEMNGSFNSKQKQGQDVTLTAFQSEFNSNRDILKANQTTTVFHHNTTNTLINHTKSSSQANNIICLPSADGEPTDNIIKFDDTDSNQKSIQMDMPTTPHYTNNFTQQTGKQTLQVVSKNQKNHKQEQNKDTIYLESPRQLSNLEVQRSPISALNTEVLKLDEIEVINQQEQAHTQSFQQISIDVETKQKKQEASQIQKLIYHILMILKIMFFGFFMNFNYTEAIQFEGLQYLTKPLCSFRATTIVFLFTFEISFNSTHFFPGLRVISIVAGVIYLIIEIIFLIDFDIKQSFIYEIYNKVTSKKQVPNQQQDQQGQQQL